MADVTISYQGTTISELNDSSNKSIKTAGKFCKDDISISYVKPETGNNIDVEAITITENGTTTAPEGKAYSPITVDVLQKTSLTNATITPAATQAYTGSQQIKTATVVSNTVTLTQGQDYTLSGNTGMNSGEYTLTATGINNFTGSKTATWFISKANSSITFSSQSLNIDISNLTGSVTANVIGDGTVSVSSSNTSVATASLSGTTLTVTAISTGSATITVNIGSGSNYNAGSATLSVTVSENGSTTVTVQDIEIQDSWDTIIEKMNNGTYKNAYNIGNYKPLDLGTEGIIDMQIVAIDNEEGSLVFVAKELLKTKNAMNSENTNANGYPATDVMRPYLNDTILPLIPEVIRQHIKPVSKTSYDKTTTADLTSTEKLWIPSAREISGGTSYEQSGPVYNLIYKDETSRKKSVVGASSFTNCWLRSASSSDDTYFHIVNRNGAVSNYAASSSNGVCLGFVLSSDNIADTWEEIGAAIQNGTYRTKYTVGDSKIVDLGDEGAISMQIVAMDADELADGSENTAAITWVSKQLLVTQKAMNSTGTNANGYPATDVMRPYLQENGMIWNKLPATLKILIKPVFKTSYDKTTAGDLTSTEKLWIPSAREIFGGSSYEKSGPVYSTIYKDSTSRTKTKFGSSSGAAWWLRSAHSRSDTSFRNVNNNGDVGGSSANNSYGVLLGFCTGDTYTE